MPKTRIVTAPPPFEGVPLPFLNLCCGLRLSLIGCNFWLSAFHAILGITTLAVGDLHQTRELYRVQLQTTPNTTWLTPQTLVSRGSLNLTGITASFFFLSAFFHIGNATLWRKYYLRGVRWCFTPSRWIEYTFSAGLMSILIAYPSGVVLVDVIVCIFALTSVTMFFGYLAELISRPSSRSVWTRPLSERLQPHLLGYVPQIVVWYLILAQFYTAVSDADASDDTRKMPDFVYAIVWGELCLFWSFGFVQLVVLCMPPIKYPYGELVYQLLSLVSKGLLGILLLANTLRD